LSSTHKCRTIAKPCFDRTERQERPSREQSRTLSFAAARYRPTPFRTFRFGLFASLCSSSPTSWRSQSLSNLSQKALPSSADRNSIISCIFPARGEENTAPWVLLDKFANQQNREFTARKQGSHYRLQGSGKLERRNSRLRILFSDVQAVASEVRFVPILLQKSAILVVGLPLRPLEADSDYWLSHWTLVGV
jgi:hypothetical protein